MSARRIIIIVIVIVILAGAVFFVLGQVNNAEEATAEVTPVSSQPQRRSGDILGIEGRLGPARDANLSFAVGGIVDEILGS